MLGTIVNVIAVLAGSMLGLLFKKGLPKNFSNTIMNGLALCVMYIGISGALSGENTLILILSMVIGAIIGSLLKLDTRIHALGDKLQARFSKGGESTIAEGFVTSTLLFCVGAMSIVGSLQSGLTGDHSTIYTKSLIDFTSAIILTSQLGIGVAFSVLPLFIYQGSIVLLASVLSPVLSSTVIAEMSCVGYVIIVGLSLNMLGLTKIKVMDYIPAIFLPILLCLFM